MADWQMVMSERDLHRRMTVTVELLVKPDWRANLGLWLMRLGARLAGFGFREDAL